jgi:hypothetical protein
LKNTEKNITQSGDIKLSIKDILDDENYSRLEKVITTLDNKKCVAFVGAGFSKSENYKDWNEVIHGTDMNNGLIKYCFEEEKYLLDDQNKKLIDIAEDCKIKNKERYHEFLEKEFGRGLAPSVHNKNHTRLWKIPFHSILTTNFDPCLYDAGRENYTITIQSYPLLNISLIQHRLYHLHGIAFDTNEPIKRRETIIFSRSEYLSAYKTSSNYLTELLTHTLQDYSIFFIGFSMSDPFILDFFKDIFENLIKRDKAIKEIYGRSINLPKHYILFPQGEPTEELRIDLRKLNIEIINFNPLNDSFFGLDYILLHILDKGNKYFLKYPSLKEDLEKGGENES